MRRFIFGLLALIGLCGVRVEAAMIVAPTSVYNNTLGELSGAFAAVNLINQSGLSSRYTSGVTDFDTVNSAGEKIDCSEFPRGWARIPGRPVTMLNAKA